jgi:deazaflavin-dependent oxidoreductase (nitroreductase family)
MSMPAQPIGDGNDDRSTSARAPLFVTLFNPLGRRLAAAGLIGPNALLTVRGRKSSLLRTTPVAFVEQDGRRWVIATFGDVNWARNLRAAGEATITIKRRKEPVLAIELSHEDAARFFREELRPYVTRLAVGRLILRLLGASDILTDPDGAARHRPVFELRPAANVDGRARSAKPDWR